MRPTLTTDAGYGARRRRGGLKVAGPLGGTMGGDSEAATPLRVTDAVFTSIPWDGGARLAHVDRHLARLQRHAARLRVPWPDDLWGPMLLAAQDTPLGTVVGAEAERPDAPAPPGLARLELQADGGVGWTLRRQLERPAGPLAAIARPAPRWTRRVTGAKHADWRPYHESRSLAEAVGADVALLVHDEAIVDGDRCTPILLDEDGTAWAASAEQGGVDSVTLELVAEGLEAAGIPLLRGRLVPSLVARAVELVVVGSGMGAEQIEELDLQPVGVEGQDRLLRTCQEALASAHRSSWADLATWRTRLEATE